MTTVTKDDLIALGYPRSTAQSIIRQAKVMLVAKGKTLYLELDKKCESILNKYSRLKNEFDLSNRDLDFRYEDFCKLNSYEDFLEKDKHGFYNFFDIKQCTN